MSASSRSQQSLQSSRPQRPDLSCARPPNSPVALFFWRWRMWVEGTFGTCMLEPWETCVLLFFVTMFVFFLVCGIYRYLPSQATFLAKRIQYYLVGTSGAGSGTLLRAEEL